MVTNVKVLGPGCRRCETAATMVRDVAAKLGIEVTVDKVTDFAEIARFGIAATPGIVIDGRVVHAGGLPRPESLEQWLGAGGAGTRLG